MPKKPKIVITGKMIEIKGSLKRHKIVEKVVTTFIKSEYLRKGKGVVFRYPVEKLSRDQLFIARPGHKKNFDFKVDVVADFGIGEGSHIEIAQDLRKKEQENPQRFEDLLNIIAQIYHCSENDVDKALAECPKLARLFKTGAKIEVILKVIKWLFIMEDIVYWDNEGRAFLYNFFIYVAKENDKKRLKGALDKIKSPDNLKSFMRKSGIEWTPVEK